MSLNKGLKITEKNNSMQIDKLHKEKRFFAISTLQLYKKGVYL